jgi:carbonic anhydrase
VRRVRVRWVVFVCNVGGVNTRVAVQEVVVRGIVVVGCLDCEGCAFAHHLLPRGLATAAVSRAKRDDEKMAEGKTSVLE